MLKPTKKEPRTLKEIHDILKDIEEQDLELHLRGANKRLNDGFMTGKTINKLIDVQHKVNNCWNIIGSLEISEI